MDPAEVRTYLEQDRAWSVYALGDLTRGRFPLCECHGADEPARAAIVLYRGFSPPVLFAIGDAVTAGELLEGIASEPAWYLHVKPEMLPEIAKRRRIVETRRMWRMVLDAEKLPKLSSEGLERLGAEHADELHDLYEQARAAGEAPGFFLPEMLAGGVFFGARCGGKLVAVAGTHMVVPEEGVAAIGNVYTRPDHRGRGLATRLTGAVAAELVCRRIPLIALNVCPSNLPALRAYQKLGFLEYCEFAEGLAVRSGSASP
ncbi:MAG: GNAT family N-acetyltransferase [Bryobacteraceae bacterium]|nr:GNAT family N-acetyltransferase [Bryobacteraceae bacterium]